MQWMIEQRGGTGIGSAGDELRLLVVTSFMLFKMHTDFSWELNIF